jgi:septal ring factor EnvC (AmiA/AmiB activator)
MTPEEIQLQIEKLKSERNLAWKSLSKISSMLYGLQETLNEVKIQHGISKMIYEQLDYKLALIDGRMQKIEGTETKERKEKGEEESMDKLINRMDSDMIKRVLEKFK